MLNIVRIFYCFVMSGVQPLQPPPILKITGLQQWFSTMCPSKFPANRLCRDLQHGTIHLKVAALQFPCTVGWFSGSDGSQSLDPKNHKVIAYPGNIISLYQQFGGKYKNIFNKATVENVNCRFLVLHGYVSHCSAAPVVIFWVRISTSWYIEHTAAVGGYRFHLLLCFPLPSSL